MHKQFISSFVDPIDLTNLDFYEFDSENDNVLAGLFVNSSKNSAYALFQGVPIFLQNAIPSDFIGSYKSKIEDFKGKFPKVIISANDNPDWSFSLEWQAHGDNQMDSTWGMTTQSRVQQFYQETLTSESEVQTQVLLDAGCGNGLLTEALSHKTKMVVGADFSTSVFMAEKRRKSPSCCFIQCDLRYLPFKAEFFDIIVSNGVIHHTDNTEFTFHKMAAKTRVGGMCYIWLYSRKGSLGWRIKRRFFDLLRVVVCRMPSFIQTAAVNMLTNILFMMYSISGKKLDKQTLHVDMYDSITPRWRYYHTPEEVSKWYHHLGFGPVTVSHWDNRYGFGVVAKRIELDENNLNVPGENYKSI